MEAIQTAPFIPPADGATDFDRILASISAGIGGYLNKAQPTGADTQTITARVVTPTANNDLLMLLVIGAAIYFLMK